MKSKKNKPTYRYHLTGTVAGQRVDEWRTYASFAQAWKLFKDWAVKRFGLPDAPPSVILKDCTIEGPDSITGKRRTILPDYP